MGKGSQVQYGFLPEPHTDFIFSVIAEEWGILGVFALFFVYGFLVWRVLKIAIESIKNIKSKTKIFIFFHIVWFLLKK